MPEYRHPLAGEDTAGRPPSRIHISRSEKAAVDDNGVFEAPRSVGEAVADRHGVAVSDTRADGSNQQSGDDSGSLVNADDKSDRVLVENGTCPWCDDYEGDSVPQHASSAHPDKWDAYKESDA